MKRTLHLTIKKKWFDMIQSGVKTEEYREIKPYWRTRLAEPVQCPNEWVSPVFYRFDHVLFVNGYGKHRPRELMECRGIKIGRGRAEWGAPTDRDVFIIRIKPVTKATNKRNNMDELDFYNIEVGIELDDKHFEIAKERVQKALADREAGI